MVLREFLLKLGLDIDESKFAEGQLAAEILKSSFEKVVDIAKDVAKEFKENIHHAIEYGNSVKLTSQAIGVTTDALQEMHYAASLSDVSAEDMTRSLGFLARKMKAAKDGSAEASKAFKGIEYKEANGELKSLDDAFVTIAERFADMPDGAKKTALAMELFSRTGKQLIPVLNKGADGIEELREEAHQLGLVMSEESVEASEEITQSLIRLKAVTLGLWRGAIAPLLPEISELVKKFLEWRKANAELFRHRLETIIRVGIKAIKFLGETLETVIKIVEFLSDAFKSMSEETKTGLLVIGAVILGFLSPITLLIAGITWVIGLFNSIRRYKEGRDSLFGDWMKSLDEWLHNDQGDIYLVKQFKMLIDLLMNAKQTIKEIDDFMQEKWNKVQMAIEKAMARTGQAVFGDANPLKDWYDHYNAEGDENPIAKQRRLDKWMQDNGYAPKPAKNPNQTVETPWSTPYIPQSDPTLQSIAPPRGAAAAGGSITQVFQVSQLPGESGEDFARRVAEISRQQRQAEYQAARAHVE